MSNFIKYLPKQREVRRVTYEPGNGTRYDLIAIKVDDMTFGALGSISSGWLVINGLNTLSYLFHDDKQPLHPDYVQEKLGGWGGDAVPLTTALGILIDCPVLTVHKVEFGSSTPAAKGEDKP